MKKKFFVVAICSVLALMPMTVMAGGVPEEQQTTSNKNSYVSSDYTRYQVSISVPQNGELELSSKCITDGSVLKVKAIPDYGYKLATIEAKTEKGTALTVKKQANGTYGITMPKENVVISATFVEK